MEGINRIKARGFLPLDLLKLQKQLWLELDDVLLQESILWAQKARCDWQIFGDSNTKFFHQKANGRRKRNFIGALRNADGDWIYETEAIKNLVTNFFTALFTEEEQNWENISCIFTYLSVPSFHLSRLGREVLHDEIKQTLFSMGALKAPGPDGMNALFYQSQCNTVGPSICEYILHL